MQHASSQRIVRGILRLIGGSTCLAFFAMFLPFDWMDAAHVWLGLGETPRQPIFAYLTRSLSAMYFAHGAIVLLVSTDVRRYLPIVKLVAFLNICLGGMLLLIDMWAGLPFYWICLEGPPIATVGCVLLRFTKDLTVA